MALKDLVTAAFGTSTAALDTSTSTLPVINVDLHPDWVRHQQQRDELATKLAAATDDANRLQRERAQAAHGVQEAEVLALLGIVPTVAPDAIAADAAIVTAQARVATITEALARLDARGDQLRYEIVCEVGANVETAAREVVSKLAKTLRDAAALSDQLATLERFERYDQVPILVRHWEELSLLNEYSKISWWLSAAQAAGLDV
jgi:hypothetical protein